MKVAYRPKDMSPTRPPNWKDERAARIARQQADRRPAEDDDDDPPRTPARARSRSRGATWDRVPVVVVGWAVLAVWWAAGGRYTIDGTPLLINEILKFFRVPPQLGPIREPVWYLYLCWLPIAFSIIERKNRPRRGLAWNVTIVYAIAIWAVVSGADAGSTWLAITNPAPDAWPLTQQVAQIPLLAGLWTLATTFAPEIGVAALWRYLRS